VGPRGAKTQRADGVFIVAEAAGIVGEVLLALVGRLGVAHPTARWRIRATRV
jgi:hypothetical protein